MADLQAAFETFTRKQLQTVLLLAQGMSNAQIANKLYLEERSVRSRIELACKRLGLEETDRTALILWAVKHGFVSEEYVIQWVIEGGPLK